MSVYFLADATVAEIAARTFEERDSCISRFLLISVPRSSGFDILKRYSEELKMFINFMDADDVNFKMGCYKVSGNTLDMGTLAMTGLCKRL